MPTMVGMTSFIFEAMLMVLLLVTVKLCAWMAEVKKESGSEERKWKWMAQSPSHL